MKIIILSLVVAILSTSCGKDSAIQKTSNHLNAYEISKCVRTGKSLQGCCSHHGGPMGCGETSQDYWATEDNKLICEDETVSSICTI